MQLFMTEAAFERVKQRLAPVLPELDVIVLDPSGGLKRVAGNGQAYQDVEPRAVRPEVVWISLDVYLSGLGQLPLITKQLMESPDCRWVQGSAAGLDGPLSRGMLEKGIRLAKSGAQAPAIAEYVMAHALSLFHPIDRQREAQTAREWRKISFKEVSDSKWLIVGFGSIGQQIARRAKAFGAHLTAIRRTPGNDPLVDAIVTTAELPQLLPEMDVVVLACALNDETCGIAGDAFFSAMQQDSIFINIARGALVDDNALRAALDRDRPAHAVLDAFDQEPLSEDAWFWSHPKVRVTAHTSYAGSGYQARADELFLENFRRYRAGEPLINEAQKWEVGL